jgi:transcriptional regulator with XRE-family HTH domain
MDASMKIDREKVRTLRELRAWSQEHLAKVSGLSVRTVQRVEREGSGLPETRLALAAALEVSAAELMGEKPGREHNRRAPFVGARAGWIGWSAGVTASLTGIFFGFLGNGSLPEALRALGVVGALAGILAGLGGVFALRGRRHQTTAAGGS